MLTLPEMCVPVSDGLIGLADNPISVRITSLNEIVTKKKNGGDGIAVGKASLLGPGQRRRD